MSTTTFVPPTINVFGGPLTELNRQDPNRVHDALRSIADAAGNKGLGAWMNSVAAQANALSTSVAATKPLTVAGTPTAADTITMTLTVPFPQLSPSAPSPIVQLIHSLTSGEAASATTAAAALVAAWNALPALAKYVTLNNAAGVITASAVLKGTAGNAFSVTAAKTGAGATTITAGGALTGGTGVNDTPLITD